MKNETYSEMFFIKAEKNNALNKQKYIEELSDVYDKLLNKM